MAEEEVTYRITFNFIDGTVVLSDRAAIGKMRAVTRALVVQNGNWEQQGIVYEWPSQLPFHVAAGSFFIQHVVDYQRPQRADEVDMANYPETAHLSVSELKEILEVAERFDCMPFAECIGYIIGMKIGSLSCAEIAAFLGLSEDPDIVH